jgi:cytochrome c biogenesis protein
MTKEKSSIIWRLFSSVKLTIVLLIILAVTSIFGTVIPQNESALDFIQRINPGMARFFDSLQLFDMYHSTWFRLIIFILAVNLIVCSLNRLPVTLKLFRMVPRPDRSRPFKDISQDRQISVERYFQGVESNVSDIMKNRYGKIEIKKNTEGTFFYGEKGKYSLFGVYIVHLSVLFILIGAIIGSSLGFKGYVEIPDGEQTNIIFLRGGKEGHQHKDLGFSVRCDKSFIDHYEDGTTKEYRSELSFIENTETVKKGDILVNHPMSFKGIRFYLSNYSVISGDMVRIRLFNSESNESSSLEIKKGEIIPLSKDGAQFRVTNVDNNLKGMMGPAIFVSIKTDEGEMGFWILKNIDILKKRFPEEMFKSPRLNPSSFSPYTFHLDGIQTRYKVAMQVNKDPGVPFVWTGFVLIMVGLIMTFFTSHKRIWVRVLKEEKGGVIHVAGKTNKNPVGLENELDHLLQKLKYVLNSEGK